jgi:hypothetical protein
MNSINDLFKKDFIQLTPKYISKINDFSSYENFRDFIINHYNLSYIEKNNYLKFVKVKRYILKFTEEEKYASYIASMNNIIKIMSDHQTFPNIDIRKYMFKINVLLNIIKERKKILLETIQNIRNIYNINNNSLIYNCSTCLRIVMGINGIHYRYKIFQKYSKQLINVIKDFMIFEESYGIDHKLIELNNIQRDLIGKKSEHVANKIIKTYMKLFVDNSTCPIMAFSNDNSSNIIGTTNERIIPQALSELTEGYRSNVGAYDFSRKNKKKFYYETNINFLKLFNIESINFKSMKGEIDGLIISEYNGKYIIEKCIEIKSSIKSTFEDIYKFLNLQNHIKNLDFTKDIIYKNYIFNRESFSNIIHNNICEWTIYICINNEHDDIIEKSHLYFSNVLKIIDDNFIKKYYINNDENVILEKYIIILNNKNKINKLFKTWMNTISLNNDKCNVFISKK